MPQVVDSENGTRPGKQHRHIMNIAGHVVNISLHRSQRIYIGQNAPQAPRLVFDDFDIAFDFRSDGTEQFFDAISATAFWSIDQNDFHGQRFICIESLAGSYPLQSSLKNALCPYPSPAVPALTRSQNPFADRNGEAGLPPMSDHWRYGWSYHFGK